jgi:CDP-diacylglycerol--serine O-phosphatidyltransferase
MKKHIPNLFTSLNLFSGCIACVMAFEGTYLWVAVWIVVAALFDFLDGLMARLLGAFSPIGKDLDSLADQISFGMAPGLIVYRFAADNISAAGVIDLAVLVPHIPYAAFLLTVFSALRLAKFNTDERQTSSFIGLPVPANALFWVSFLYGASKWATAESAFAFVLIVMALVVVFSFLMISEIPMFSLKAKHIGWKGNELRYVLIVSVLAAVILAGIPGLALGILFYIALSIAATLKKSKA